MVRCQYRQHQGIPGKFTLEGPEKICRSYNIFMIIKYSAAIFNTGDMKTLYVVHKLGKNMRKIAEAELDEVLN